MTIGQDPDTRRRAGPPTGRQWILVGAVAGAVVLLLAAAVAVALRLNRADAHAVTAPLKDRREARFEMASGVGAMTVRVGDLGDHLYRISTPPGGRAPVPHVTDRNNVIQLRLTGGGGGGGSGVQVRLSSRVRWGLRLSVGLGQTTIDLRGGSVSTVEFAAGVGMADLALPVPSGTVPVRVGAGANQLTVHLRPGVPAQVRVRAGIGNLTLDGTTRSGVRDGSVYPLGGYAHARNRYDIDLATGIASLVVRRD
jgi:hypothetical protein